MIDLNLSQATHSRERFSKGHWENRLEGVDVLAAPGPAFKQDVVCQVDKLELFIGRRCGRGRKKKTEEEVKRSVEGQSVFIRRFFRISNTRLVCILHSWAL